MGLGRATSVTEVMEGELQLTRQKPVFLHLAVEALCGGGGGGEGAVERQERKKNRERQIGLVEERQLCVRGSSPSLKSLMYIYTLGL